MAHTFPSELDGRAWDRALPPLMHERGMALIPTLKLFAYELAKTNLPPAVVERVIGNAREQVSMFSGLGGQVLFGTDVGYMTEYDPTDEGEEKLGAYTAQKLMLKGKPGLDLAFPMIRIWIDKDTKNVLKRQEYALSGKLLRTSYYPKWKKVFSESKNGEVWYPQEIRFFDEVEKANSTLILIRAVDLHPLEANLFTKAWLESKSR